MIYNSTLFSSLVVLFTILDTVELSDLIGVGGLCKLFIIVLFGYKPDLLHGEIGLLPMLLLLSS